MGVEYMYTKAGAGWELCMYSWRVPFVLLMKLCRGRDEQTTYDL